MGLATDYLWLQIFVDGNELPLQNMPLLKLALFSRLKTYMPVGEVVISDPLRINNRLLNLTDGTPVQIRVGTSSENSQLYNFRTFRPKVVPGSTGEALQFSMYFDNPSYFSQRTTKAFTGNTSDLVNYVTQQCGMQAKVEATQDSQHWIPMNRRWCEFLAKSVSAGYKGPKSCMELGYRLDNILVYKDIDALNFTGAEAHQFLTGLFGDPAQRIWPCISHKSHASSGFVNQQVGYALKQVGHSFKSAVSDISDTVSKTRQSEYMNMNVGLQKTMKEGQRVLPATFDTGNMHDNYQRAVYQNMRSSAVNSGRLDLLTNQLTSCDLLDPVVARMVALSQTDQENPNSLDQDASGNYYVGAKTIFVDARATYTERFTLHRDGKNTNLNSKERDL